MEEGGLKAATRSKEDTSPIVGPLVQEMWKRNQLPSQGATVGAVSLGKSQLGLESERNMRKKRVSCLFIEFQRHRGRILSSGIRDGVI